MLMLLLLLTLATRMTESIICGEGVPILTRTLSSNGTYLVEFQCYCPIDYYGIQCRTHRQIHCYLTTNDFTPSTITSQNFQEQMQLTVKITSECFIEYSNNKYLPIINYFLGKSLQQGTLSIAQSLQTDFEQTQIIWANDTSLFDEQGRLKYQQGYNFTFDNFGNKQLSKQDQAKIIHGAGPYRFSYNSTFLGIPLSNSLFLIRPTIIMVTKNSYSLQNQSFSFINQQEYINYTQQVLAKAEDSITKIPKNPIDFTDNFQQILQQAQQIAKDARNFSKLTVTPMIQCTVTIRPREQAEFGMIRVQVSIAQQLSEKYTAATSVNAAQVRVPIRIPGIGQARVYNKNFDPPTSRYIFFLAATASLAALYALYVFCRNLKLKNIRKIQKAIEEDSELQQQN